MAIAKPDIVHLLETNRQALKRFGVRRVGVFGSAARGTASAGSDVDVLVTLDQPSFDGYMDLKFFLEELFHREVDLVLEPALKPRLRASILNEVMYASGF